MAIKPDPKTIYLSPGCNYDREWCENDVWSECNECGVKSVRYILDSDHIDSHRFDEAAERVRFTEHFGFPPEQDIITWGIWRACALAREKEFVG